MYLAQGLRFKTRQGHSPACAESPGADNGGSVWAHFGTIAEITRAVTPPAAARPPRHPPMGTWGDHRTGHAGIKPKEAPSSMGRSSSQKPKGIAGGGILLGLLAAQGSCCCPWLTMAVSGTCTLRDRVSGWQCWVRVPQGSQGGCSVGVLEGHVPLPREQM